jgi:hypothetical protein
MGRSRDGKDKKWIKKMSVCNTKVRGHAEKKGLVTKIILKYILRNNVYGWD